jgi:HSP20 family protein
MSYPVRPSWRGQGGGRRDPFASLEAMQDRVNRLLGDAITGYRGRTPLWHPDIDVDETGDGWVIEARLPGVAPEEVAVDVSDRELTIRAVHDEAEDEARARRYADFSYRLTIPSDVDTDAIEATMDHGLLTVRLPRSTTSRTRRISVGQRNVIQGETAPADARNEPPAESYDAAAGSTYAQAADDSVLGPPAEEAVASDTEPREHGTVDQPIPTTEGKNMPGA